MQVHALLLAAGASKRYGSAKALAPWANTTLLHYVCEELLALLPLTVVLGAHATTLQAQIPPAALSVRASDWQQGMGRSIACGVQALPDTADAVLIALMDQALITRQHYQMLHTCYMNDSEKICASRYAQRLGAPVIFPRRYFGSLIQLTGDRGAQHLLREEALQIVDMPEAAYDVDEPSMWPQVQAYIDAKK